jgi:YegS/Rv2252/BmrU family lipid kinase
MSKRFLLIANPASGSPPRASVRDQALAGLRAAGAQVDLQVTLSAGHLFEIAREHDLAGYDALCVLGGDGSMHEAVSGLLQRPQPLHVPVGLIPAGTGNSLGLSLGITDVAEAVRRIVAGKSRAVDVVRATAAGETHFCLNLIGWAAGQAINATAERLRWLGPPRYAAAAFWHVLSARPRPAKIVLDGVVHEDRFLLLLACNTKYVGSGMLAAPRATIDDGLLDVVIVRRASRWRMLRLLQRVHDGSHVEMREVEYHEVRSLRIETASPEPLNLDGELKGTTPLVAEVLPGAIVLLT